MARKRSNQPAYIQYKQSRRGRLVWCDHDGGRREKLLPGPHDRPESLEANTRLELEIATGHKPDRGDDIPTTPQA